MEKSYTLVRITESGIGYRNDLYFGSGVTDAAEVLHYEVMVLCNLSALTFCKERYNIGFDWEFIRKKIDAGIWECPADVYYDAPEVIVEGYHALLQYCYDFFGTYDLHALWLSSLEGVMQHYCDPGENSIREYSLPEHYLVVDDLDDQGILIVTPTPISSLEYREIVVQRR